jgi:hypothetical protein
LLALVLACWALTINKKAAQSARLAGILDTSELSERLRVGMQAPTQPVQPQISWQFQAFAATSGQFRSFASEPPRTEALHMYAAPGLFMTTESLPPLVQSQPLDAHQEQIAQAATGPLPAFRSFAGEFTPFEPQTWGASLCPASPDETPVARQPVGAGSGRPGGLLSRYREGEFSA